MASDGTADEPLNPVSLAARDIPPPATISDGARRHLSAAAAMPPTQRPAPDDIEGWRRAVVASEEMFRPIVDGILANCSADISDAEVGGVTTYVGVPRGRSVAAPIYLYFHGGASLSEAIVPVLIARLDTEEPQATGKLMIELSYKSGAKRITTRVPVIEIAVETDDMFAREQSIEVLVEAQDTRGKVIGEPRPGSEVNAATRTLTLVPGERKQIALRMDPDFEGKFTVKALNPTTLASYSALQLETDYTV